MSETLITQDVARALVEAGYMPLEDYLRLCRERGWQSVVSQTRLRYEAK